MKVRSDYVTNSSSSCFVLAREGEMNERQKEEILKFIEKEFLGRPILTPASTEEEIEEVFEDEGGFYRDDIQSEAREALQEGKSIYHGWVNYDDCEYDYAGVFEKIWEILEEYGDGNFVAINDDLSY